MSTLALNVEGTKIKLTYVTWPFGAGFFICHLH